MPASVFSPEDPSHISAPFSLYSFLASTHPTYFFFFFLSLSTKWIRDPGKWLPAPGLVALSRAPGPHLPPHEHEPPHLKPSWEWRQHKEEEAKEEVRPAPERPLSLGPVMSLSPPQPGRATSLSALPEPSSLVISLISESVLSTELLELHTPCLCLAYGSWLQPLPWPLRGLLAQGPLLAFPHPQRPR